MRVTALIQLLAVGAGCTLAAQPPDSLPVTVAQLEDFLNQEKAAHSGDDEVAQKLAGAELTERLTDIQLDRLKTELNPGAKTVTELNLLADLSAFLEPPAGELPAVAPPDAAAQKQILDAAANFAAVTLRGLPDFVAIRTAQSFEDVPILTADTSTQSGMHLVDTTVHEMAYRNGLEFSKSETPDLGSAGSRGAAQPGLSSAGEFGPVLAVIMTDAGHGRIAWGHWEQTPGGLAAVFRYDVPREASHYEVSFCCAWDPDTRRQVQYHGRPGYHGTISVSPSTGTVMRLTLEAAIEDFDPPPRFGLVVRYGEVSIEGKSLVCPLHSAVILHTTQVARKRVWNVVHVNDIVFTGYRRFGSTAHVVGKAAAK